MNIKRGWTAALRESDEVKALVEVLEKAKDQKMLKWISNSDNIQIQVEFYPFREALENYKKALEGA